MKSKNIDYVKQCTDEELEIFVRTRLGQENPELMEHGKEHLRLDLHSATFTQISNNTKIMALFEDCFDLGDHDHGFIVYGYKGGFYIGRVNGEPIEFSELGGCGTVETLKFLLKTIPAKGFMNGN